MEKQKTMRTKKSSIFLIAFVAMLLSFSAPQQAHAEIVTDIIADAKLTIQTVIQNAQLAAQLAKNAYDAVEDQLKLMETSWATAVEAVGKNLQARINSMLTQNHMTADRQNVSIAATLAINHESFHPANDNVCATAESVHQFDVANMQTKEITQAMTQGMQTRPSHPAAVATEIANECGTGFAPTTAGDPQASSYLSLDPSCPTNSPHARQDRTIEAVLGPTEYPIPANLPMPKNGIWKQLTTVPAEKYYPFAAALSYCENVTPPLPTPPQGVPGKPTAELLSINAYKTAESQTSVVPGSCYGAVLMRMQVGSDASAWQNVHNEQAKLCADDFASFVIDTDENSDCQANGRSTLQAEKDKAYATGSGSFQTNVLNLVQFDTKQILLSNGVAHVLTYEANRTAERAQIIDSIGVGKQGAASVGQAQSQQVQ